MENFAPKITDHKKSAELNKILYGYEDCDATVVHVSDVSKAVNSFTDIDAADIYVSDDSDSDAHALRGVSKIVHTKWTKDPICKAVPENVYMQALELEDVRAAWRLTQKNPGLKDKLKASLNKSKTFRSTLWRRAYRTLFEGDVDPQIEKLKSISDNDAASMLDFIEQNSSENGQPAAMPAQAAPGGEEEGEEDGNGSGSGNNPAEEEGDPDNKMNASVFGSKAEAEANKMHWGSLIQSDEVAQFNEDLPIKKRKPTTYEWTVAAKTFRQFQKAVYRDRFVVETTNQLPPGKLNGRLHSQQMLAERGGVNLRVEKWNRRQRKQHILPPLKVGFAFDVSGSMTAMTAMTTKLNWIFANAIRGIEGEFCSYAFGDGTTQVIANHTGSKFVLEVPANGGSEDIDSAIARIDTEIGLVGSRGPRLLVLLSDFEIVSHSRDERARGMLDTMKRDGVHIVCVKPHHHHTSYDKYGAVVMPDTVHECAEVIASRCIRLLESC